MWAFKHRKRAFFIYFSQFSMVLSLKVPCRWRILFPMTLNPKYSRSGSMTISLTGRGTHYSHCNAMLKARRADTLGTCTRKCSPKAPNCQFIGDPDICFDSTLNFTFKMGEMQLTLQCPANSVLLTNHLGLTLQVLELSELSYERIVNRNLEGRKEGQVKSHNNIANSDDENFCVLQNRTELSFSVFCSHLTLRKTGIPPFQGEVRPNWCSCAHPPCRTLPC